MPHLALFALALTLAAEPSGAAAAAPSPPASLTEAASASAPPSASAAPCASAPSAKPGEEDIEVLDEVVDLQEDEDPTAAWYGKSYPHPLRILALSTARTVRKGGGEFLLDHRASRPIYDTGNGEAAANMWNHFLGLDSGLAVGLGFRFGILYRLDAGLYRVGGGRFDTYEFDARFQALSQDDRGIDLMIRGGLSWFVVPNHDDALWPFAQVYASRLFANRLLATAGVMVHANSSASTTRGIKYRNEEHKGSVAWGAGLEYRFASVVALDAEIVSCTAGFCSKNPAFSGGLKFFTARHTFALVCGNTQYLTADSYITNSVTPWSELVIGFNLTREH